MLELTTYDLTVIASLAFFAGIFASIFIARFLEVVHAWRIVQETLVSVVWMLSKMVEDIYFLQELKRKQMRESGFTD